MNFIGDNLRKIRQAHKLTQGDVADSLGIERSTYTCYELGKTEPSIYSLARIAKMYGISLSSLLFGCEEKTPEICKRYSVDILAASTDPLSLLEKDEKLLLISFRLLDDEKKKEFLDMIRAAANNE